MDCLLGLVRTNGITLLTYRVSKVAKVDLHLIWTAKIYKNRHTSLIFLSTDSAAGRSRWDCPYPSQLYCWMRQCVYVDKLFSLWFNPPRDPKEGIKNWPSCLCKCRFGDDSAATIFGRYDLLFVLDIPDAPILTRTISGYHTTKWLRPQIKRLFPPLSPRHHVRTIAYAVL